MAVTILVEPEVESVMCTNCGERIPVSPKVVENWAFCQACDEPLVLVNAATGKAMNQTWAELKSTLEQRMAQAFAVSRFPSEAVARSWKALEKRFPQRVIDEAITACREGYADRRQRCWTDVIAYVKTRNHGSGADSATELDAGGLAI